MCLHDGDGSRLQVTCSASGVHSLRREKVSGVGEVRVPNRSISVQRNPQPRGLPVRRPSYMLYCERLPNVTCYMRVGDQKENASQDPILVRGQILPPELASSKQRSDKGGVVISVRRRKDGGVAI